MGFRVVSYGALGELLLWVGGGPVQYKLFTALSASWSNAHNTVQQLFFSDTPYDEGNRKVFSLCLNSAVDRHRFNSIGSWFYNRGAATENERSPIFCDRVSYLKPRPHQQQCRSNVRLCCQKRQQCRTLKLRPLDKVECCFDIVACVDRA